MDFNLPVQSPNQSIWEKYSGRHLALARALADQSRQKNDLGALFANARQGYTPEDQDRMQKEGQLRDLTAQFTEATKDLDDSAYQQAAERFMQEYGAPAPERQTAQLQNPNLLQSGFALLAAALDSQNAAQIASQPFGFQMQDQQRRQGQMDQEHTDALRQRKEAIDVAETRMNIEERKLGKSQTSQDRKANMIRMQMSDVQASLDKLDQRKQQAVNHAYSQWNAANTPQEKAVAGRRLQELLKGTGLEPSDQEIEEAAGFLQEQNTYRASTEWERAIKNEENAYGEVSEERAADLERMRQSIAKAYGIEIERLRPVRTGKTIAAQKLALSQEQFKFLQNKTADDFKLKWANLQVAKERAATYAQSVANGLMLGTTRNEISYGNLQMRQFEAQARNVRDAMKSVASASRSQLQSLLNKIKAESDPEKQAKLRNDLTLLATHLSPELGLSPKDILWNPIKRIDDFLKALDAEEVSEKAQAFPELPEINITLPEDKKLGVGDGKGNIVTGKIGGKTAKAPAKAAPKPASKPPASSLPSGWKFSG